MHKLDLHPIIAFTQVDPRILAEVLFPTNSYQIMALNRQLRGDGFLSDNQIQRLSDFTGIEVEDLTNLEFLRENNVSLRYRKGSFDVTINVLNWTASVFCTQTKRFGNVKLSGGSKLSEILSKIEL